MLRDDGIHDLLRSGISEEQAFAAGMYTEDDASAVYEEFEALPALVLPYYHPTTFENLTFERDGQTLPFARCRYLAEPPARIGFRQRKAQRYGQPRRSGVKPYFPVQCGVDWNAVLNDPTYPVVITEGEKKATAGCLQGVPTLGLGGVYNFVENGDFLDLLEEIHWKGRPVFIAFDSDASDKPMIQAAEARLASELSLKRKAQVHLIRIPQQGHGKSGLDDLIVEKGRNAFLDLVDTAPQLRRIDSEVIDLNRHVAWIEREGKVYDIAGGHWMSKDSFKQGSVYSTRKIVQPTLKGQGVKEVSVAEEWLTHPEARRYADVLFDPTTDEREVYDLGDNHCLNLWEGFDTEPGDVSPFTALNDYVFSTLDNEMRDLPLKLAAYKMQNPGIKTPLALVLLGMQGSGKTMWASIIRDAFGVHGAEIPSKALLSDYNGWVEKSLWGVLNEAKPEHVAKGAETLKRLISEDTDYLNEKYRVARQVKTYTMYCITANDRRVGSYDGDDRRMVVLDCARPHPQGKAFYLPILKWWKEEGGPRKLAHYLLEYDLQGWRPPVRAPLTAEKYMAKMENASVVERLAEEMQTAEVHTIALWISQAIQSASAAELSNDHYVAARARETKTALSTIQIRPWYTPDELAMLFPMVAEQFFNNKRLKGTAAGDISRQLREAGVPYLLNKDDPRGFRRGGRLCQYLVIANPEQFPSAITQNEFDRQMRQFPTYAQFADQHAARRPK